MKKTKLISIVLAAIMVLSMIPFAMIPVSAAVSATEMPTALPGNKTMVNSLQWIDWNTTGGMISDYTLSDDKEYVISNGKNGVVWPKTDNESVAWQTASGIMFYVDKGTATENISFYVDIITSAEASNEKNVQFKSVPTYHNNGVANYSPGFVSTTYYYDATNSKWEAITTSANTNPSGEQDTTTWGYYTGTKQGSGWFYIPFESFYCVSDAFPAGKNMLEVMPQLDNQKIRQMGIQSEVNGIKFGDVYFVYDKMPNTYPVDDGTTSVAYGKTQTFFDMSKAGSVSHTGRGTTETNLSSSLKYNSKADADGRNKLLDTGASNNNNSIVTKSGVGATGMMFYLDGSKSSGGFVLSFSVNTTRHLGNDTDTNLDNDQDSMFFDSTATQTTNSGSHTVEGGCTYYINMGSGWQSYNTSNAFIGQANTAGWYYIPFSSFYYYGGWNLNDAFADAYNADKEVVETTYAYLLEHSLNWNSANITNIQFEAENKEAVFNIGDIYFVYPQNDVAADSSATADMFYVMNKSSTENQDNYGSWTFDVNKENNSVTIAGATGVSDTQSKGRIWLNGMVDDNSLDLTKAEGIRFNLNTKGLSGSDLKLRIRLQEGGAPNTLLSNYKIIATNAVGNAKQVAPTSESNIQYVLRSAGSVVYIKAEGASEWKAVYANSAAATGTEADIITLPRDFEGEVYIPMDSFWCSLGSYGSSLISWDTAVANGLGDHICAMVISQGYTDNTNAATNSVTYSNFVAVYEDVQLTSEKVNVADDLAMKVTATVKDEATITGATATLGGVKTTARVENNVVICDGILPQNVAKTLNITVTSKTKDNVVITNTYSTSVKDYCLALIGGEYDEKAKAVAADLLRYAAAADTYVNGSSDILNGVELGELGNKTEAPTANNSAVSTAPETGYSIDSVALVLEGALKVKINVSVPEVGAATIEYRIAGDTETSTADVKDGAALIAIGAADLNKEIQVKLVVGGDAVQYLKYSMSDYFADYLNDETVAEKDLALVTAVYNYCASAAAYAKSLATN